MSLKFPVMTVESIPISTGSDADYFGNLLIILEFIQRALLIWLEIPIESIRMEKLSAAMTNTVYIISHSHSHYKIDYLIDEPEKLLLRVYGNGIDNILNRTDELSWFVKLSKAHAGPKLLATFKNGRIEEYIESTTLTPKLMSSTDTSLKIATALAQFHQLNVKNNENTFKMSKNRLESDYISDNDDKSSDSSSDNSSFIIEYDVDDGSITWSRLIIWRQEALKSFQSLRIKFVDNLEISSVLEKIKKFKVLGENNFRENEKYGRFLKSLKDLNSPIVPCHNDLQHGNILWSHEKDKIVFIDYEYGGMNYAAYDISNHFCEWAGDYTEENLTPQVMNFEANYPNFEQQERFIRKYLKELAGPEINDEMVIMWMLTVDRFKNLSHLLWAYWGIIQANHSTNDFDYLGYALIRLEAMDI